MYSKSLGLDCQPFFFAALLPFQIPTPGIFPYCFVLKIFKVSNTGPTHRGKTQNLKVPIHRGPTHSEKNLKSQSPHTHTEAHSQGKNRKIPSKSLHTGAPHTVEKKTLKSQSPRSRVFKKAMIKAAKKTLIGVFNI